jgi:hypothetical protein
LPLLYTLLVLVLLVLLEQGILLCSSLPAAAVLVLLRKQLIGQIGKQPAA